MILLRNLKFQNFVYSVFISLECRPDTPKMKSKHIAMVYQEGQKHRYGSTRIFEIRVDPYF